MSRHRIVLAVLLVSLVISASFCVLPVRAADSRKFALIVGIGQGYAHPAFRTLQYPEQDAHRMAVALQKLGFEIQDEVLGATATAQAIKSAFGKLAQKADHPDDLVVVYYSGHGAIQKASDREVPSLVPSDADPRQPSTFITDTELGQWLSFIKAKRILLILDSCYSAGIGGAEKRLTEAEQVTPQDVQARLRQIKQAQFVGAMFQSTVIMASSQARETSKETDKGGLFTYYLLQGLGDDARGSCPACEQGTNEVTPQSWLKYTAKGVLASADQEPQLQLPQTGEQLSLLIPWIKPLPGATVRPRPTAPSPPASVKPSVPRPGTIVLKLNVGGLDVVVNGTTVQTGVGPEIRLENMKAATYFIEVSKPGYLPKTVKVVLHDGEQAKVIVNLSPRPASTQKGQLTIATDPAGAKVTIDGKTYATPVTGLLLAPGKYKIRVSAKGYVLLERELQVLADKENRYSIKLKKEDPGEYYAQGRKAYLLFTPDGYAAAVKWYKKALAVDSKYALAYAGLGETLALWGYLHQQQGVPYQGSYEQAYQFSQKAIALNPGLPDAQRSLARTAKYFGKPGYEEAARKALESNDKDAESWHALWYATGNERDPDHETIRKALELNPNLVIVRLDRGVALAGAKRYDEAAGEFREVLRANPGNPVAFVHLGSALIELKRYDEAAAACRETLGLTPNYAWAFFNLGRALAGLKQHDEAIGPYRDAIRLAPDRADFHFRLGEALASLNRYDDAVSAYREAVRIDAARAEFHRSLGLGLAGLKRHEEAIAAHREALRLNPEYAQAHFDLGSELAKLRQYDEAIQEYRAAVRITPDHALAHFHLGTTLAELKRRDEAVAAYRQAIRLVPNDPDIHFSLANALAGLQRYEDAVPEFREALRLNANDARFYSGLGSALSELKRYDEAAAEYREAIRITPSEAGFRFQLGKVLAELKRYDDAIAAYREAVQINANDAMAFNNMGTVLAKLKRTDEAIGAYRQAIRIDPNQADFRNNLGHILLPLDRYREALIEFREALRIDPDHAPARRGLAIVRYWLYQTPGLAWW